MKKVIILVGLPGSGKSTWLKKNARDAVIVCPDKIRSLVFGHQFHLDAEGFVWAYAESMAKLILQQGKSVIIDATNLFPHLRSRWKNLGEKYEAECHVVWMDTDPKVCWKRNILRPKNERVPKHAFQRMVRAFDHPSAKSELIRVRRVR